MPEQPVGKFGRPLFQSMTYHDTPSRPMPQMRYLATSARAGEEHAYSVITVNSVGLESPPSDKGDTSTSTLKRTMPRLHQTR